MAIEVNLIKKNLNDSMELLPHHTIKDLEISIINTSTLLALIAHSYELLNSKGENVEELKVTMQELVTIINNNH